jgi:hypothetical protein
MEKDRIGVSDIIREMHRWADCRDDSQQIEAWAAALEAAMREPVATANKQGLVHEYFPRGTKLFALPPDAAGEIERLQESCRRREDRATEASHQASVLANVCADQKRKIERLREAAETALECLENNGFGRAYAVDMLRAALAKE